MSNGDTRNPFDLQNNLPRFVFMDNNLMVEVFRTLNPNEYDPRMEKAIQDCAHRYSALIVYAHNTIRQIEYYRKNEFQEDLSFVNKDLPVERSAFCELYCPGVLANFEAFLLATKSFLDVLCRNLLRQRIGVSVDGFHKDGRDVGGKVLKTLQKSVSLNKLSSRDDLIKLIADHKASWIDQLVGMRDIVAHTGELDNYIGFWTVIEAGRTNPYSEIDVSDPVIRFGASEENVYSYCQRILSSVSQFTKSFRDLLYPPNFRTLMSDRLQK